MKIILCHVLCILLAISLGKFSKSEEIFSTKYEPNPTQIAIGSPRSGTCISEEECGRETIKPTFVNTPENIITKIDEKFTGNDVQRYEMNVDCDGISDEECSVKATKIFEDYCAKNNVEICKHYRILEYNECNLSGYKCSTNGKCIETSDGYKCKCNEGYKDIGKTRLGTRCQSCKALDESHCYESFYKEKHNFTAAKKLCEDRGGQLPDLYSHDHLTKMAGFLVEHNHERAGKWAANTFLLEENQLFLNNGTKVIDDFEWTNTTKMWTNVAFWERRLNTLKPEAKRLVLCQF